MKILHFITSLCALTTANAFITQRAFAKKSTMLGKSSPGLNNNTGFPLQNDTKKIVLICQNIDANTKNRQSKDRRQEHRQQEKWLMIKAPEIPKTKEAVRLKLLKIIVTAANYTIARRWGVFGRKLKLFAARRRWKQINWG